MSKTDTTKKVGGHIAGTLGWFGVGVAARKILDGDTLGGAIAKEIPWSIAFAIAPGAMGIATIAPLIPMAWNGMVGLNNQVKQAYKGQRTVNPEFKYMDTNQAMTMRQASVQAIQGSKMNARNALGGEAALMHRGYGDRRI